MAQIPRGPRLDGTIGFLTAGYGFVSRWCERLHANRFATRFMLKDVVFIRGEEAARAFYQPDRFTRRGAMPASTVRLLQDKGSVQMLDGAAHRARKAMFMGMMTPVEIQRLVDDVDRIWRGRLPAWATQEQVALHDEVRTILCQAACDWVGIPLSASEVAPRTRELGAMIDNAGKLGPANWWASLLRLRTERWTGQIVEWVRAGSLGTAKDSPLAAIVWYRDPDDQRLTTKEATVEILNLLRPIVAIGEYIVFAARALQAHPEWRERLRAADETELEWFVQEVRRYYPFFPFIGGKALVDFEWDGHLFTHGTWMLLDLYGTDHEAAVWNDPNVFRPERFRDWDGSPYNLIPQGGGDYLANHRCPGEAITLAVMKQAARLLTTAMTYDVPAQDLKVDLARVPAQPRSGFVMTNVTAV
jgi:fatty-acid peroxygenase